MKLLISALALGFVAASAPAAEATVCAHSKAHCAGAQHMAYAHHHHYAYGYPYGYPPPPYGPYAYPPILGYANPPVYNPQPGIYGPYPWSWGYRNTLNLLLNLEGDRPFAD
jgi:hypothetical protein